MWQSNGSAGYNHGGEVTSYNSNNHQPQMTQMQGYQPFHQASGWGQFSHGGIATNPAMHSSNGPLPHAFNGSGFPNSHNDPSGNRNSFSNQGPDHVQQGQGSWHPHNSASKALPSPVFRNGPANPQPHMWPIHDAGSFNNYAGQGYPNNQNHHLAQGPRAPMEGYQPMQFTPPNHRPNFLGPPGRGSFPPNHRGSRGGRGQARGGNGNGPGRGRGRNQTPQPGKGIGKFKEGKHPPTHVCDPCERWFNNEEMLAKHVSEHRTCGIDGCKLTAHTSVVDKHIKMQHDTGLFLKMKDLVNSDDFAKWRAERKLRYPSKENIAKRQDAQDEKLKRGESLVDESGRFPRNRGGNANRGNRRQRGRGRGFSERMNQADSQNDFVPNKFSNTKKGDNRKPPAAIKAKMPFSRTIDEEQIQDTLTKEEREFSDTEWEPDSETGRGKSAEEVPKLSAALNTLASMYDSDSAESETDASKPMKVESGVADQAGDAIDEAAESPMEVPICRVAQEKEGISDGESPREVPSKRNNQRYQRNEERHKRRKMDHGGRNNSGFKRKPEVSLLQKLLASEIRHERNVVLQCIRYIVENNFLSVTMTNKARKIDSAPPTCGPETEWRDTEMELSSSAEVLTGCELLGKAEKMDSTLLTCESATALPDIKMELSEPVT